MNTETPTPASTAATIASPADPLVQPQVAVEVARGMVAPRLRPMIYPALTVLATGIVVAGQIVEDLTRIPPLQMLAWPPLLPRWAVVALVLYSMVMSAIIMRSATRSLAAVRSVVDIKQELFDRYTDRMANTSPAIDAGLFVLSGLIKFPAVRRPGLGSAAR